MIAQAIGRWGNYFNQELFGRPTTLPWALHIDPANRPADTPEIAIYHPTFLYECLWDLAVAGLLVWAQRRHRLANGRLFALYVAAYTVGRGWIEALRVDHANHILGLRLNDWTSLITSSPLPRTYGKPRAAAPATPSLSRCQMPPPLAPSVAERLIVNAHADLLDRVHHRSRTAATTACPCRRLFGGLLTRRWARRPDEWAGVLPV